MEDLFRNNFDNFILINFLQNGGCEYVVLWMVNMGKLDMDCFVISDFRNCLFDVLFMDFFIISFGVMFSFDFVVLNIQCGRDYGLFGYNVFR